MNTNTIHLAGALVTAAVLMSCSSTKPQPLTQEVEVPAGAKCDDIDWSQRYERGNPIRDTACGKCVVDVQTCVRSKGQAYCAEACNSCLGEELCRFPQNVAWASQMIAEAGTPKDHIRALVEPFSTSRGMGDDLFVTSVEQTDSRESAHLRVRDYSGAILWEWPADACMDPIVRSAWISQYCDDYVEVRRPKDGFVVGVFPWTPVPAGDLHYVALDFDENLEFALSAGRIVDTEMKTIADHTDAREVLRVSPSWADRVVIFSDRIEHYEGNKLVQKHATDSKRRYGNVQYAVVRSATSVVMMDTTGRDRGYRTYNYKTRTLNDYVEYGKEGGYLRLSSGGIYVEFPRGAFYAARTVFPVDGTTVSLPGSTVSSTLKSRWHVPGGEIRAWGIVDDEIMGTIIMPQLMSGLGGYPRPNATAVVIKNDELQPASELHHTVLWMAQVPGTNQFWIGSTEGLVKKWDFDTGKSRKIDVPYEFAVGQGRVDFNGNLVLRNVAVEKEHYVAGTKVMLQADTDAPVIVDLKTKVYDVNMPEKDRLLAVTEKSLITYSVARKRVTKRQKGNWTLSADGSAAVKHESEHNGFKVIPKDAKIIRTIGKAKTITAKKASSCGLSPRGRYAICLEEFDPETSEGVFRHYELKTGKVTHEGRGMATGSLKEVSSTGKQVFMSTMVEMTDIINFEGPSRTAIREGIQHWLLFTDDGRVVAQTGQFLRLEEP